MTKPKKPFARMVYDQINQYIDNFEKIDKNGRDIDIKIILQLIYFKYNGDEIFDFIAQMNTKANRRYPKRP